MPAKQGNTAHDGEIHASETLQLVKVKYLCNHRLQEPVSVKQLWWPSDLDKTRGGRNYLLL